MTLKSTIPADIAATVFNTDEFAEEITYTPRSGDDQTIRAQLGADLDAFEDSDVARYDRKSMEIVVPRATDIGIARPSIEDTVTISDEKWSVMRIVRQDDFVSVLEIARVRIGERHGEGYDSDGSR